MIYTLLIPGIIFYIVFSYIPLSGLTLAFKQFRANLGIWGSPWTGFQNFEYVFRDRAFWQSIQKTIYINLGRLVFQFPAPIILALLFNELRMRRYKRVLQTIYTFPHFFSWIIVGSIITNTLAINGLVNQIIQAAGGTPVSFLGSRGLFVPLLYITDIWKAAGYGSIIYLASISGIDVQQYEAAEIDGATRWQQLIHITLPNIMPTVIIMFILACGGLMTAGFDQIFNLSNAAVKDVSEVLDMYIYRITFQSAPDFGFSTAVSLFRSIINMTLILGANKIAKMLGGDGLIS
jgi:putative aldouronate transport system permease protein